MWHVFDLSEEQNSCCCTGRSPNCLKILYFTISMNYEGTAYSEYFLWPQTHLTSQGDVLQSAQSGQAVLWAVSLQIISLLDRYAFNYLVKGDHVGFGGSSRVLVAQEDAQDFPRMSFWPATARIWRTLPHLACGCQKVHSGDIL